MDGVIVDGKQTIVYTIDPPETEQVGFAIILHGIGSHKDNPQVMSLAKSLRQSGLATLRFTQPIQGERQVTLTFFKQNLETALARITRHELYRPNPILCGHSLGAATALQYTLEHRRQVGKLILLAPMPVGLPVRFWLSQEQRREGETTGKFSRPSSSEPGVVRKQDYNLIRDAMRYQHLGRLWTVPVPTLGIIGDKDTTVPVSYCRWLFRLARHRRHILRLIPGAGHTLAAVDLKLIDDLMRWWL